MINGTEMTKNSGTFGVVVGWVIDLLVISETETGSLNTWAQEIFPGHILGDNFVYFGLIQGRCPTTFAGLVCGWSTKWHSLNSNAEHFLKNKSNYFF